MFLIAGVLAAILSSRTTGNGQVVDACISDGVVSMMSLFYAWRQNGLWQDAPVSNLLDGAAPFYRCYRCADGRDVAVACLEPQFFKQMVEGLELEDREYDQLDRKGWPAMEADFAAVFATRPRDHWAARFAQSDACVTPVLSMTEAPAHSHNRGRRTFASVDGTVQPAPAPRMSGTPGSISPPGILSVEDALARWANPA